MAQSKYLNYHFSGDVCQSVEQGVEGSYNATLTLTNYLANLSIDNAQEKELENIGLWIGYPRPYIPSEFLTTNAFLFDSLSSRTALPALPAAIPMSLDHHIYSPLHGFSGLDAPLDGGRFTSVLNTETKLPLDIYRAILKVIAFIKWHGWTMEALDKMFYLAGLSYTFSWDSLNDVVVTFTPLDTINPIYIYIFGQIIAMFETLPRINIIS
jgi:hypothetical protein